MKLETLEEMWSIDSKIDRSSLDAESLKIPELHQKYYKLYLREKFQFKSDENMYNQFFKLKHEYYTGKLSSEELKEFGWEPFQFVLKGDLQIYLDADKEICERLLKLEIQKEKIRFLESIIENLNRRSFSIKNAIEFIKFSNGI